jgi:hypothetical protein
MVTNGEGPQAMPLFRKLALGMAIVFILLGGVFALAPIDKNSKSLGWPSCLFAAMVMMAIGKPYWWPPPAKR